MKKYIALFLAVMMAFSVCGCGKSSKPVEKTEAKEESKVDMSDDDSLKVGFLFSSNGTTFDYTSRKAAIDKTQYDLGLSENQVIIKDNVSVEKAKETIEDMVSAGCTLIFSMDRDFEDAVVAAAADHPEVEFCQEDGKQAKDSGLSNMHNYYSRIYEAYYLAGTLAGVKLNRMLNNGEISPSDCLVGFVANQDDAENASCYTAFYLGIKQVCSRAYVYVRVVGSEGVFDDDGRAAKQLVAAGAGLMCTHVYTSAVAAVCAENGIPVFGNDASIIKYASKRAITSVNTDWSVYYKEMITMISEGKDLPVDWCEGYSKEAVGITQLNDAKIVDGTIEKVQEVESDLRKGKVDIFKLENFRIDGQSLDDLIAEGGDYKKYKDLVKDGVYYESLNRSKPSWHLMIDGEEFSTYDYVGEIEAQEESTAESTEEN